MPELAIITLSRDAAHLRRLGDALNTQVGAPDCERFLVDNTVHAGLGPLARSYGWTSGIALHRNTTFSEGCNLGVERTTSPYLLMLNDDAIPHINFLAALWQQRESASVVGALLLHKDGTVNHAGTGVWAPDCRTDHLGRGAPRSDYDGQDFAVTPAATFAAALIKRSTWQALGGLDEGYCYGWEDTDFCLRAIRAGGMVGVARRAVAVHDECGTRPRGGARDRDNYILFSSRWAETLPQLLKDYAARHPNAEGLS